MEAGVTGTTFLDTGKGIEELFAIHTEYAEAQSIYFEVRTFTHTHTHTHSTYTCIIFILFYFDLLLITLLLETIGINCKLNIL